MRDIAERKENEKPMTSASDDLRGRLADAIINGVYDHLTRSAALAAADQVILELGIREELKYPNREPDYTFMPPQCRRYVTDWVCDA